jgi:hypothetical protein
MAVVGSRIWTRSEKTAVALVGNVLVFVPIRRHTIRRINGTIHLELVIRSFICCLPVDPGRLQTNSAVLGTRQQHEAYLQGRDWCFIGQFYDRIARIFATEKLCRWTNLSIGLHPPLFLVLGMAQDPPIISIPVTSRCIPND